MSANKDGGEIVALAFALGTCQFPGYDAHVKKQDGIWAARSHTSKGPL